MIKNPAVLLSRKVLLVLGLLVPAALAGCGGGGLGSMPTISGQIDGWTMGSGHVLQAQTTGATSMQFANTPIATDGSFSLTLIPPSTLNPLGAGTYCSSSGTCQVQSSPTMVMSAELGLTIPGIASVQPQKLVSGSSATIAYYTYVDNDITLTGKAPLSSTITATLDLHYKAGWNIHLITSTPSQVTITSTQSIADLKWELVN